jgi:hypothetical protein
MFGVLSQLHERLGLALGSVDCDWWIQINGWDPFIPVQVIIRSPSVRERQVHDRTLTKVNVSQQSLYDWQMDEQLCLRETEDLVRKLKRTLTGSEE